jgi:YYY domain-containing protein
MLFNLLSWYLLLLILGWINFPLTYRLFKRFPERGYTLSRILGLLLWGFGFWWMGSLGLLQNQPGGILFALALLIGLNLWVGWKKWGEIGRWIRENWQLILSVEAVFLVAFAFMTLVRASDPAATGTEKPMELAFINAVLNSESFPPKDPWLSGYAISYYHFGYILAGMLAKLTFTSGGVAFNLMLVSVFAMSAVGAYGILINLLSLFTNRDKPNNKILWLGLFAPVFLLFVGNLEVVLEIFHQLGLGWDGRGNPAPFWQWVNIDSLLNAPIGETTFIPQRFWWWWQASRVVQDIDLLGNVSGLSPIDEFPAFSFVLGDLHPHVLVMPFVMLIIGLGLNVYMGGLDGETVIGRFRLPFSLRLFLICAITLGGIAFLNTWDLPVYFALVVGAYSLRQVRLKGWSWDRLIELLTLAIPLGVLSLLLYTPFFISFQSQAGGILPNLIYPTRGLYLWLMFGSLLLPILLFFGWLLRERKPVKWRKALNLVLAFVVVLALLSILIGARISQMDIGQSVIASQGETTFIGFLGSALLHRLQLGFGLLSLLLVLIVGLAFLLGISSEEKTEGHHEHTVVYFVLLMVVLGGVMVLAPEFLYLQDSFGTRMNTVFKFYYQAWMLWALAASFGSVIIFTRGRLVSKILIVLVIFAGLLYPALAYPTKTKNFQPAQGYSLDASAYFATFYPDEDGAVRWLSQAPEGVVAEAIGGQYSAYARVATLSGQATVLGWPGHEGQWRGGYDEVGSRESDIRRLYEAADWETALDVIRQYDIHYIYVGSLERNTYPVNLEKFEQNLEIGFQQGAALVFVVPEILFD